MHWSAKTTTNKGGSWLNIDENTSASGVTPAYPSVGVRVTGLTPGTYTGAIIFSAAPGTQTLPVTLIMGPPAAPSLTATPATLSFDAVVGQPGPDPQTITITNSGGKTLTWNATAATSVGGSWLAVKPVSGALASQDSTPGTVTATLLAALVPGAYNGTVTLTASCGSWPPARESPRQSPVS